MDLDKAVEVALLFEELEDDYQFVSAPSSPSAPYTTPHRYISSRYFSTPRQSVQRAQPDRKVKEVPLTATTEDKWTQLRNFRKAKGLCFICGEKWAKDHQCRSSM